MNKLTCLWRGKSCNCRRSINIYIHKHKHISPHTQPTKGVGTIGNCWGLKAIFWVGSACFLCRNERAVREVGSFRNWRSRFHSFNKITQQQTSTFHLPTTPQFIASLPAATAIVNKKAKIFIFPTKTKRWNIYEPIMRPDGLTVSPALELFLQHHRGESKS